MPSQHPEKPTDRIRLCFLLGTTVLLGTTLLYLHQPVHLSPTPPSSFSPPSSALKPFKSHPEKPFTPLSSSSVTCIRAASWSTHEGIGALLRRHELAVALAEIHAAKLEFPSKASIHGYDSGSFFDTCPTPSMPAREARRAPPAREARRAGPGEGVSEKCAVHQDRLAMARCPRGNCTCVAEGIFAATERLVEGCGVVDVFGDGHKHMEFGGCYNGTLERYFAGGPLIKGEYAAIHLRQGDLASAKGGKVLSVMEQVGVIGFLCRATDLPIVISTEGNPKMPICPGRMFLASNTTIPETVRLFRHAKVIVVSSSSFSRMIAQGTKAAWIVATERSLGYYIWARGVRMSVVTKDGVLHHYRDTGDMMRAFTSPGGFWAESYSTGGGAVERERVLELVQQSWRELL